MVFTSRYYFVVLFSSWCGFAGVLWCRHILSFRYFLCFNLYSMMVPSLTAGSVYPWGGGGGVLLALRRFVTCSSWKDSESGILMPSGLLVWQIPYREIVSLGLKVSIRHGSRLPCLCCVVSGGASRLTVGPCRP